MIVFESVMFPVVSDNAKILILKQITTKSKIII